MSVKETSFMNSYSSDGAADNQQVAAGDGDVACSIPDETEAKGLLPVQPTDGNGEMMSSDHAAECQGNQGNAWTPRESSSMCRVKRQMNEVFSSKGRLWLVIVAILVLIVTVILISLFVCSAMHQDKDENFNSSLFKLPRYFNGSFQLPNLVFTEKLFNFSSTESKALAADLQEQLADLYRSSPALGRYFSKAEIFAFRDGSVIADYQLMFVMPEEQQNQLRNFTLSREMVYNVFRQFLYDQEPDESGRMYVDPLSLKMFLRH